MNVDIARMQYESIQPQKKAQEMQNSRSDDKLYKACQDFEALFVKQMLKSMKSTINRSGLLDGGFAEEIYDDMLYEEYAKKMVKTAGFGIARTLYEKLSFSGHG